MPHIHDKIDYTVETFVVYRDKVLLRFHEKYNIWLTPGGHIELDENPNQAAIREVKEEAGLDIELVPTQEMLTYDDSNDVHLIAPAYLNQHPINETHTHIAFIYFAKTNDDEITQNSISEISEDCRWFTKEEVNNLDKGISKTIKHYAIKAIEHVSQKI